MYYIGSTQYRLAFCVTPVMYMWLKLIIIIIIKNNNNWEQPHGFRQVLNPGPDRRRNEEGSSVVDDNGPTHCRSTHMPPSHPALVLESDASQKGWGAHCMETSTGGCWSSMEAQYHINYLELLAAFLALKTFANHQKGLILLKMDSVISSDIHQPKRGHTLNTTVQSSPSDLAVVHPERNYVKSGTSAGQSQHNCRYGIPDGQGQMRLDDQSKSVPTNTTVTGTTGDRSVCFSPNQTTAQVLQLETRPRSRGNRCFSTELGSSKRVCQPPMVPNTMVSDPDKTTAGRSFVNNTTLAFSTLVSSPSRDVAGLPLSTPISSGSDIDPIQSRTHNSAGSSNAGRMAYLRESFTSRGISTQASDLLLSSWRDKTNTSYNSLFAKWASWCDQRSRDPTAGPVEDVVNFLAELFTEGYQYRSLNAYRSAISSIPEGRRTEYT